LVHWFHYPLETIQNTDFRHDTNSKILGSLNKRRFLIMNGINDYIGFLIEGYDDIGGLTEILIGVDKTNINSVINENWENMAGVHFRAAIDVFCGPINRENLKAALKMYAYMINVRK